MSSKKHAAPSENHQSAAVTLNGNPVDVGFAGLVAGQVGLYRIDLTVPPDAVAGDLKLVVGQNGLSSNTVLLTVGAQP